MLRYNTIHTGTPAGPPVDNLTHTLFALTLANAGFRRAGRGVTATLVLASSVPDLEFVTGLAGGRLAYLSAHRGPTHGPLGLALGAAMAACVFLARRWAGRRDDDATFPALVLAGLAGVAGHVAIDFATSYGTRVLSPFSDVWYGVDWLPIVDPWLLAVLGAGLIAAWLRPGARHRLAVGALVVMAGYYGLRASAHDDAMQQAVAREQAAGVRGDQGARRLFAYLDERRPAGLPAALPTEMSPFRWRLITRTPGGFEVAEIDVRHRDRVRGKVLRFRNDRDRLVREAASAPTARAFLGFSRFPSVEVMRHRNGDVTVHWYDMRFAEAPPPGDPRSAISPFGAWVRMTPEGRLLGHGLGPG
jgi:inner membrane protein